MRVIGITGGVGSGKTELLRYIGQHYHCRIIRADEVSHQLMQPGGAIYAPLLALLEQYSPKEDPQNAKHGCTNEELTKQVNKSTGTEKDIDDSKDRGKRSEILNADGTINHAQMAARIFAHQDLLAQVNALIHPAVRRYIDQAIEEERRQKKNDYLFIEAALLIEEGYDQVVDELWYIYCDPAIRRQRLFSSRSYSDEKINAIMQAQLSDAQFREKADVVIDNSTTLEAAYRQIDRFLT